MKMIVAVALAFVALAVAAPPIPSPLQGAQIVRSEFSQQPEGGYQYGYESDNGIKREETGELKEAFDEDKKPHTVVAVRGSFSYTDPEGKIETINYFADETGYHPEGDSIPKPIPNRR